MIANEMSNPGRVRSAKGYAWLKESSAAPSCSAALYLELLCLEIHLHLEGCQSAASLSAKAEKGAFKMAKTRVSASQRDALERARSAKRQRQDGGKEEEREAALQSGAATPTAAPTTRRRSGHAKPSTAVATAQNTAAAGSSPAGQKRGGGARRLRSQKSEQGPPSTAEEEAEGEEGDEAEGAEEGGHQLRSKSMQSLAGGLEDRHAHVLVQ